MNQIPERLNKFVSQRFTLTVMSVLCILIIGSFITYEVGNDSNIWFIVFASMFGMHFSYKIITAHLIKTIYDGDAGEFINDVAEINNGNKTGPAKEQLNKEIKIEIIDHSENHVATYMDADCHEWIDIKYADKVKRLKFFGTIDMSREYSVPVGCILLNPGILYQLDEESTNLFSKEFSGDDK